MKRFILIRHGKTAGNLEGRYIGRRTDEPLCEEGRAALMKKCAPHADCVHISPMLRCRETAEILYPGMPAAPVDGLQECDFGEFEGKNYAELNGRADYQAWIDSGGEAPFPGGESRAEFAQRCVAAFEEYAAGLADGTHAFIVHGGTIMALMENFTKNPGSYFDFQVKNGEGYLLDMDGKYEKLRDIRRFESDDLDENFLDGFAHEQEWDRQWMPCSERNAVGAALEWRLEEKGGLRTWNAEKRRWIPGYLEEQIARGGAAFGAYEGGRLVGFCAVDGQIVRERANLTMLFVDDRFKRRGYGSALFDEAIRAAEKMGAQWLYISAIPAEETVAFYMRMCCRDAVFIPEFADHEHDRPLEIVIWNNHKSEYVLRSADLLPTPLGDIVIEDENGNRIPFDTVREPYGRIYEMEKERETIGTLSMPPEIFRIWPYMENMRTNEQYRIRLLGRSMLYFGCGSYENCYGVSEGDALAALGGLGMSEYVSRDDLERKCGHDADRICDAIVHDGPLFAHKEDDGIGFWIAEDQKKEFCFTAGWMRRGCFAEEEYREALTFWMCM